MNLLWFNLILQIYLLAKFPSEWVAQNRVESFKSFVIYEHQYLDIWQPQHTQPQMVIKALWYRSVCNIYFEW